MPVSTPIYPTVGPTEGVSVFSGRGVGLQRSGCRSAAAYAGRTAAAVLRTGGRWPPPYAPKLRGIRPHLLRLPPELQHFRTRRPNFGANKCHLCILRRPAAAGAVANGSRAPQNAVSQLHSTRDLQTMSLFILFSICAIYCTLPDPVI